MTIYLGTVNDTPYVISSVSSFSESEGEVNVQKYLGVLVTPLTVRRANGTTWLSNITRSIVLPDVVNETALSFSDVSADDYFCEALSWAIENGVARGVNDSTFAPNDSVTRAQMVTLIWRAAGRPAPVSDTEVTGAAVSTAVSDPEVTGAAASAADVFTDVDAEAYYADALEWAYSAGVVNGMTPDTFAPDSVLTRRMAVTMIERATGEAPKTDASVSPDSAATRAMAVTFLWRSFGAGED
jgi:phage gp46-like protein